MAESNEYKRWLASGDSQRTVIECINLYHPKWGSTRLANYPNDVTTTDENGYKGVYIASRFYLTPPETTDTTSQSTSLTISSLDGLIYDKIKGLSFEDRQTPIQIVHRMWLTSDLTKVLINPPPIWTVHSANATHEAVVAELRAEALRVQRIGLYYTAHEFPAIVYL